MVFSNKNVHIFKRKMLKKNKVDGNYLLNKSMEFKEKKYFQDSN